MAMHEQRYRRWRALRGLPHMTLRWSMADAGGSVDGRLSTVQVPLTQRDGGRPYPSGSSATRNRACPISSPAT